MARYMCLTECTWAGRYWKYGDIYDGPKTPPQYYFTEMENKPETSGSSEIDEDAVRRIVREELSGVHGCDCETATTDEIRAMAVDILR